MANPIDDLGYRYATQRYPCDGTTTVWEFNFDGGYLSRDYVEALIQDANNVQTKLVITPDDFLGPNTLQIIPAYPAGNTLIIRRNTPKDVPLLDFVDGAILNAQNLNTTTKQAIQSCAEMVDLFEDLYDAFKGVNDDVINIIAIANEALAIAKQARDIANSAVGIANNAVGIANEALDAANNAISIANSAVATAQNAVDIANGAVTSANDAIAIANGAVTTAENAVTIANNAVDIANQANDKADATQALANDAANSAAAAAQSALDALNATAAILEASKRMEIAFYASGLISNTNEEFLRYVVGRPFDVIVESYELASLQVATTNAMTLNISKNGMTTIGTVFFDAMQVTGTVRITEAISFAKGDILNLTSTGGDATAAGLGVTLLGVRNEV